MSIAAIPLLVIIGILILRGLSKTGSSSESNRNIDTDHSTNSFEQDIHQQHHQQAVLNASHHTMPDDPVQQTFATGMNDFNLPHETEHHHHQDTPHTDHHFDAYNNTDSTFTDHSSQSFDSSFTDSSSSSSSMDSTSFSND